MDYHDQEVTVELSCGCKGHYMGCNVLIAIRLVWGVKEVKLLMFGSCLCCFMHKNSFLFFLLHLLKTTSPATPVIYSIKLLILNFLSDDFLALKRGDHSENQRVIGYTWSLKEGVKN